MANRCNYKCAYCDFSDIDDPIGERWIDFWEYVVAHYASGNVRMVGGEPSIHPAMPKVARVFAKKHPHFVLSLFSNTSNSRAVIEIADILGPALHLNASCHPDDPRFSRKKFFDTVVEARKRRAHIMVCMVLYSTTIGLVPIVQRECNERGISLALQTCLGFPMTTQDEELSKSINGANSKSDYQFNRLYDGWKKNVLESFR
jgi:MoaA/NifB/PqqE/SkfB family radical SAM enzyme